MSFDSAKHLKNQILTPKQRGNLVFIYNEKGQVVRIYKTIDLGKAFFQMNNDAFYDIYGFNFVPQGEWWKISKRAAGKA